MHIQKDQLYKTAFLLIATIMGFLMFARMGMHIADDGIVLAATKRIVVDGEIPHRDFISLRPVGTFFFWAPTVLFGGEYVNTLSRLITMLQFALIAFFWISLFEKLYDIKLRAYPWLCLYIITYFFSFNTFWLFPLYTTDGVFFSSLGCWLIFKEKKYLHYLGFLMIGVSCLAKHNFAAMIPAALIASSNLKNPKAYLFSMLAPLLYLLWLYSFNAFQDFQTQMSQYPLSSTFLETGVFPYLKNKYFFIGAALALMSLISNPKIKRYTLNATRLIFATHLLQILFFRGYLSRGPIFLAGFTLIILFHTYINQNRKTSAYLFLACGLAWVSSFSLVFQYPHAAGYLVPPLFLYLFRNIFLPEGRSFSLKPLAFSLLTVLAFTYHRYQFTFENHTSLHSPNLIQNEYPGAKGMIVGKLLFNIFSDLNLKYEKYKKEGREVVIFPDFTNFWVTKETKNPLPTLWIVGTDIVSPELTNRVIKKINDLRVGSIFLVENFSGYSLHWRPTGEQKLIKPPRWDGVIEIMLNHIRNKSKLLETGQYFDIYEKIDRK